MYTTNHTSDKMANSSKTQVAKRGTKRTITHITEQREGLIYIYIYHIMGSNNKGGITECQTQLSVNFYRHNSLGVILNGILFGVDEIKSARLISEGSHARVQSKC